MVSAIDSKLKPLRWSPKPREAYTYEGQGVAALSLFDEVGVWNLMWLLMRDLFETAPADSVVTQNIAVGYVAGLSYTPTSKGCFIHEIAARTGPNNALYLIGEEAKVSPDVGRFTCQVYWQVMLEMARKETHLSLPSNVIRADFSAKRRPSLK